MKVEELHRLKEANRLLNKIEEKKCLTNLLNSPYRKGYSYVLHVKNECGILCGVLDLDDEFRKIIASVISEKIKVLQDEFDNL